MNKENVLNLICKISLGEVDNMINVDLIKELIDRIPEIKTLFKTEKFEMFSSYDRNTGQRKKSGMEFRTIYKQPEFLKWKEQLCFELNKIENDDYINEMIHLLKNFGGLGDESRFEKLESKLNVLREHLEEYREDYSEVRIRDDSRVPEKEICDKVFRAISKMQRNHHYNAKCSEDTMNDYIRDILDESYIMKDQTRQGESEEGEHAGEVDIQICYNGLPVVMIEGVKISSLEKNTLDTHMNKVLTKYDPNGCPYAFLIIYTTVKNFGLGYQKILEYFQKYDYPYSRETDLVDESTEYGELKHAQIVLNRNNQKTRVHIWTAHII